MNLSEIVIHRLPFIAPEEANNVIYATVVYAQYFSAENIDDLLDNGRPYPAKPKKTSDDL